MYPLFARLRALTDDAGDTRAKIVTLYGILLTANIGTWIWAIVAFRDFPVLLGTACLAYSLGLRHAVDADHIAAIDNVTRKLMQEGKRPVTVGAMFALGHSTVVLLGSTVIVGATLSLQRQVESIREFGAIVGTSLSSLFLFGVAIANVFVLRSTYLAFRRVRRGEPHSEEDFHMLTGGGLLSRFFGPMFAVIDKSSHMFPLGMLFGLGFDTATEIGLLGMSASEASRGLSFWSILVFPALFTAGMSLIDTTDNVLMLGAYGWAFIKPIRKLYYNLTITAVSVVVAFIIGGIEALGLLAGHAGLHGGFWNLIAELNGNFGMLGYLIVALFIASWALSIAVYKWRNYEEAALEAASACPVHPE